MKLLSHLIGIITIILMLLGSGIMENYILFLVIALYAGVLMFVSSKNSLKGIGIYSLVLVILVGALNIVFQSLVNRVDNLNNQAGAGSASTLMPMFAVAPWWIIILPGIIMFGSAALIKWLESKTKKDQQGYRKNPVLVLIYSIMFPIIYHVLWFYGLKQSLAKDGEQLPSLWWLALPVIGTVYLQITFSQSLERKTRIHFLAWFLVFLLVNGVENVIIQIMINHKISSETVA